METLTLPLCGEPRAAYCYVHPAKARQFEKYVRTRLHGYCSLHKAEELVRKGWFGLFRPNKDLMHRVGQGVDQTTGKMPVPHNPSNVERRAA